MAFFVDRLLKALSATFASPSSELKEESVDIPGSSTVENCSNIVSPLETESSTAINMPGIFNSDDDENSKSSILVEEKQKISEIIKDPDVDAVDVLNELLLKLDLNGRNESLLSCLDNELETSGDAEFVDAADSLLLKANNGESFAVDFNNSEFFVKDEKLFEITGIKEENLDFSLSEDLKSNCFTSSENNNSEILQSSTPIIDEVDCCENAKITEEVDLSGNYDIASENTDKQFDVNNPNISEISYDSFETAASSKSMTAEDRPISSKGEYSISDLEKLMSDDSAVESLDPFGGRASAKNKTFTRKAPKQKDESDTADESKEDLNANAVEESNISAEQNKTVSKPLNVSQKQPMEDYANSNVEKTQLPPAVIDKDATPKMPKQNNIDETPKKSKSESVKQQAVISKPNPGQTARVASVQQTAVVAPMINKNEAARNVAASAMGGKQDDNVSEEEFVMASSDLFADPSALDYLQKAGSNSAVDSELYRQSLYVNFDPIVAEKMANKVAAAKLNVPKTTAPVAQQPQVAKAQITQNSAVAANGHNETLTNEETETVEDDLLLMKTPSPKPGAQTTPSCPPTVVLKKKPAGSQSRQSGEVDNILNMNPKQQTAVDAEQPETSTQQLKMQFQAYILSKEKEWVAKFKEERERSERIARELANANERVSTAEKSASEMKLIVTEYDKTIRDLMRQLEKQKPNKHGDYDQVFKDKEQALEDLQSVENAFSELHRRYEKLRTSTEDFKKNEEKLRECLTDVQSKLKSSEEKFRKLKEHAEEKLESANSEIERLQKAKESDTLALRTLVKKRDLQVASLEKSLEQKHKEIQELSSICDELIQKVDYPQNTKSNGV